MESKKHTTENQNLTQKNQSRELRIVKNLANVKSNVWNHFGVIVNADKQLVDGFAACKKCKRVLAYDSQRTGTSSLKKHIGRCTTLKLKREAAIKAEKTMSKSTYEEEEDEEEDEHLTKTGMSKQDPNTSEVAMTEDGAAEQFEFQYGLEGPTFKNDNGECSKSHLSIIKVEQLDPLLPDQNDSSCGSGSPRDPGPPGSSGFGSSMSPAAQFFRKCHQAGCTQFIFSEFASRLNTITERISSQQASEEDFNLTLKVLEASGMLPEIFAKRDQEMEKRLKDLQRETESVRTARSAMRDACVMSVTPS
ncbi:uncharacterized protein LOC115186319 isoform X2 [Salmo trutta]|uniref:uncharacterized protein LOC115155852 isoform X2 n=1 Tax=Salmo trutta TaxID=8032 RepID=UPI0011308D90|nr:uncharacterized protein LOC115155852 isoform X2 [Salmo trutta]XP_029601853.1 uncharacterized protein LOC115186319 isoform X2 [Salmo trutta]